MQARGYEIVEDDCPPYLQKEMSMPKPDPDSYNSLTQNQKDKFNIETGKKIVAIEGMQKIEPACYEPMGWLGKRSLRLEKWLKISN
jgi:hypothetical protein